MQANALWAGLFPTSKLHWIQSLAGLEFATVHQFLMQQLVAYFGQTEITSGTNLWCDSM